MSSIADLISAWKPARMYPETYPGRYPDGHYLYFRDSTLEITQSAHSDGAYDVLFQGSATPLDQFLSTTGSPALMDRIPVLAYGANRNPATLGIKLLNYQYSGRAEPCIPVLTATLDDADVVACQLHGQGYMYGELLMGSPFAEGVELDVHVLLVDDDGLRVLNESEGVAEGLYSVVRIPGVHVAGLPHPIAPLGYVANARIWRSPTFDSPIGFSSIPAAKRRIPTMTPRQMMDHALDVLELRETVTGITGLNQEHLARDLAKYLNGQWWYAFNTGDDPISGFSHALAEIAAAMEHDTLATRTYDYLKEKGCAVESDMLHPDSMGDVRSRFSLRAMIDEPF